MRPFVFLNAAMTADGKLATANRALSSFSSKRDRTHMLELRATADAVMSGARTVDLNPINLGPGPVRFRRLRVKRGLAEYNLRVVVSGRGTVNPDAELFKGKFSPVIVLTTERAGKARLKRLRAVADEVKIVGRREIDFRRALTWLARKWGVKRLVCEGGGEINNVLFRAGVVDELHLTVCPKVFGGRGAPTLADGIGVPRLAQATRLELKSARRYEKELFLVYRVCHCNGC
ncbi:MAG TPA: dihydrofolate reductase family protein [Verrucomicrobiae bacterium]|nr:dihydrofolate reductase family protein [Verrucomicrobiae bacterium]